MTKKAFEDGDFVRHAFEPIGIGTTKIKIQKKSIPAKWRQVAWIRKRSKFWAIVYEIKILSEEEFQVTEVSVLGIAKEPPLLNDQGSPFYQATPRQEVEPVARWQLIEASNRFNELSHDLFAWVIAWARLGGDKPFLVQVLDLQAKASKSVKAKEKLYRIAKEHGENLNPRKRISWTQRKLKDLIRRAEEIDRELDRNNIGEKQRDRNARLAVELGVSVKTIEQRLKEARDKGFGSEKPKVRPKRKGK